MGRSSLPPYESCDHCEAYIYDSQTTLFPDDHVLKTYLHLKNYVKYRSELTNMIHRIVVHLQHQTLSCDIDEVAIKELAVIYDPENITRTLVFQHTILLKYLERVPAAAREIRWLSNYLIERNILRHPERRPLPEFEKLAWMGTVIRFYFRQLEQLHPRLRSIESIHGLNSPPDSKEEYAPL